MQQWDLRLPEIGETVDLLKALVKSRIEKMPEEERDSYRDYMMHKDLKNRATSWGEVVEYVDMVVNLIEDNQDAEDVQSKRPGTPHREEGWKIQRERKRGERRRQERRRCAGQRDSAQGQEQRPRKRR